MATSKSGAQEVITCDICDVPAQRFCNDCQTNLCLDCVRKHLDELDSLSHDIVPFRNRKVLFVFPKCWIHSGHGCEAYCQQCHIPVCVKCLIGPHNGHDARDLVSFVEGKKQDIMKDTEEIESHLLAKYQTTYSDIEIKTDKAIAEYAKLEQENERLRHIWHQEVNGIFDKSGSLIRNMKENDKAVLKRIETKINNLIPDMIQTVQHNKDIIKSNKTSGIINYNSKLKEYRDLPKHDNVKIPPLVANGLPGIEISIEIGGMKATLTQTSLDRPLYTIPVLNLPTKKLMKQARVIASISTDHRILYRVACVGTGQAWISGEKNITRINILGSVLDMINFTQQNWPRYISVTRLGELIYTDTGTVKIFRQGRNETLIAVQGWEARALCCTRSGDILVNIHTNGRNKIVRYQDQEKTQEIDKDEHGNPIFTVGGFMLYLTENINGDICVSDSKAETVVILDRTGRVRVKYNGVKARRQLPFSPRCIVTDCMGQIVITDLNNNCLHILDQNGNFIRCVDNCGLYKPSGLSVDKEGRLWVGLLGEGKVKVLEYLE